MTGRAYITAVGAFLPGEPVSNADLEATLGQVNGKASRSMGPVLRSNGITSRYYAINRETGEPIWPIEERPVMQTEVPGNYTAPTQPYWQVFAPPGKQPRQAA